MFTYRNAFEYLRYGYAAAATIVLVALTLLAVIVQWRLTAATDPGTTGNVAARCYGLSPPRSNLDMATRLRSRRDVRPLDRRE